VRAKLVDAATRKPLSYAPLTGPVMRVGDTIEWASAWSNEQGVTVLCGVLPGTIRLGATSSGYLGRYFDKEVRGDLDLGTLALEQRPEWNTPVQGEAFLSHFPNEAGFAFVEFGDGMPAWAATAGLRAGDEILTIDGRPTKGALWSELYELIDGPPGTTLRMRIRHAGKEREITVLR
jgi:hypothetical protein